MVIDFNVMLLYMSTQTLSEKKSIITCLESTDLELYV